MIKNGFHGLTPIKQKESQHQADSHGGKNVEDSLFVHVDTYYELG